MRPKNTFLYSQRQEPCREQAPIADPRFDSRWWRSAAPRRAVDVHVPVPAEGRRIVVCMNQRPIRGEAGKVKRFGRDVLQAALVDLTSKALLYVGGGLLVAFLLLVFFGGSVPAWLLAVVALVAVVVVFLSWRHIPRLRGEVRSRDGEIEELEPFKQGTLELEGTVGAPRRGAGRPASGLKSSRLGYHGGYGYAYAYAQSKPEPPTGDATPAGEVSPNGAVSAGESSGEEPVPTARG